MRTADDNKRQTKNYSFFQHIKCEYFPCHEIDDTGDFNCLFCYCPLYFLGSDCGGSFSYTKSGVKDCTDCLVPHSRESYPLIIKKLATAIDKQKK